MTENHEFGNTIREAFLHAFPNPDRSGCPSDETLKELARNRLPIAHPAMAHMSSCSPCCKEFLQLQTAWHHSRRRNRVQTIAAVAIMAVAVTGGIWVHHTRREVLPHTPQISEIADLWSWPTSRGDEGHLRGLSWPRAAIVNLTIVLPRGADGGLYRIVVTKDPTKGNPVARTAAHSTAISHTPLKYRLVAVLDLRSAAPGTYLLQITDPTNLTYSYPLRIT